MPMTAVSNYPAAADTGGLALGQPWRASATHAVSCAHQPALLFIGQRRWIEQVNLPLRAGLPWPLRQSATTPDLRHHRLVEARDFQFAIEQLGELDDAQRVFLDHVAETIRRIQPPELDMGAIDVAMEDGRLMVLLPHRHDDERMVAAIVAKDEAVVSYSYEHEHFWPDDPVKGREWPVDAQNFIVAGALFVEQLLLGRIELEVRQGILMLKTKSYWINDVGEREVFLRSGTLLPTFRRRPPRVIRIDFGLKSDR